MRKICIFCGKEFNSNGNRLTCSDVCNKNREKEYAKIWNENNKDWRKFYNSENRKKISHYYKKYNEIRKKEDKEYNNYCKKYRKEWHKNNKKYISNYRKNKYNNDIYFKIKCQLYTRIYQTLKENKKLEGTTKLLGCSITFFKKYIENQFKPNMSWDNYSKYGWHIDHIKPCNTFDLSIYEQQQKCFHYTNLRPLWAKENWKRPKSGNDII